jgi:hypothetical protein
MNRGKNNLSFVCKISLLLALLIVQGAYQKGYFQNKKAGEIARRAQRIEKQFSTRTMRSSFVSDTSFIRITQEKQVY